MPVEPQGVAVSHSSDKIADQAVGLLFLLWAFRSRAFLPFCIGPTWEFMFQEKGIEVADNILGLFKLAMDQRIPVDILIEEGP